MKFNKIRFYLYNLDSIEKEIKLLHERIMIHNEYNDINITVSIKECIQSSNSDKSSVELSAINRIENIDNLLLKITELQNLKLAISTTMIYLSETENNVLTMRYFATQGEKNSFNYISYKLKYSLRYVKLVDSKIITKIRDKYLELTK